MLSGEWRRASLKLSMTRSPFTRSSWELRRSPAMNRAEANGFRPGRSFHFANNSLGKSYINGRKLAKGARGPRRGFLDPRRPLDAEGRFTHRQPLGSRCDLVGQEECIRVANHAARG